MSACPSLTGAVTKRHNDAGSLNVQAIHEEERGAELVMINVGLTRRCTLMKGKGRIPLTALPDEMPVGAVFACAASLMPCWSEQRRKISTTNCSKSNFAGTLTHPSRKTERNASTTV